MGEEIQGPEETESTESLSAAAAVSTGETRPSAAAFVLSRPSTFWVGLAAVVGVFIGLYFVQGYSTGLMLGDRDTLWESMRAGYERSNGEWSFGYLVPVAVLALIWFMRREFAELEVKPANWSGLLVVGLALFFYFGGYRANVAYVGYFSGQLLVMGSILFFLGWKWFRKGFWIWCLFGMVWPLDFLLQPVAVTLGEIMVRLTTVVLNLFGVQAIPSGTTVMTNTPDPITGDPISLNIALACSGMRSLFALIMIGLVFAAVMLKSEWKRWLLMACIPLIAVVGNFGRMITLYLGARIGGTEFAIGAGEGNESAFHIGSGLVVFVIALILVSTIVEVMNRGFKVFRKRRKVTRTVVAGDQKTGNQEA